MESNAVQDIYKTFKKWRKNTIDQSLKFLKMGEKIGWLEKLKLRISLIYQFAMCAYVFARMRMDDEIRFLNTMFQSLNDVSSNT